MVLVTGATGFIGRNLVSHFISAGIPTAVLLHKSSVAPSLEGKVQILTADITSQESLQGLPDISFSAIIHLAAYIPASDKGTAARRCLDVNIQGTDNLIEFARTRTINKFVHASSILAYGASSPPEGYTEDSPLAPLTYYGISKAAGDMLTHRGTHVHGIRGTSLRLSFVYGPGMPENFVFGRFLDQALKGDPITIYGRGSATRDYIYIKDVVNAFSAALHDSQGGCYNIGSGVGISLAELARSINKATGNRSKLTCMENEREDLSNAVLDIAKASREIGFSPRYSLEEGLLEMISEMAA